MTTATQGFRHEALVYEGDADFVRRTLGFVRDGLAAGEPVLVALPQPRLGLLQAALGADAGRVSFADMADVGVNPARIIAVWCDFVAEADGRPARGIGEPIWAGRPADEIDECVIHEALLNHAFPPEPSWWLLCPYDATTLPAAVIAEARRTHPYLMDRTGHRESADYTGAQDPLAGELPPPPPHADELRFDHETLRGVRAEVARRAAAHGIAEARARDLVLAMHELATNSLRYGGGGGVLRVWREGDALVCEVRDAGWIASPLVGRLRPGRDEEGGRGLWLVNQLFDTVQVRSVPAGTVVRVRVPLAA